MENQEILDNQSSSGNISAETRDNLGSLAKWMNLAGLLGMVGSVLSFVTSISTKEFNTVMGNIIGFALSMMLFNAAKSLKAFSENGQSADWTKFASSILTYWKVTGILIIIVLAFVAIALLFVLAIAGSR